LPLLRLTDDIRLIGNRLTKTCQTLLKNGKKFSMQKMTQEIISDMNESWITELDNQQLLDLFRLTI